jgi:acyl-CoA dehydrogenase
VLAEMLANIRIIRIVDGPDEVHLMQIARNEIKKSATIQQSFIGKRYRGARL